MLAAENDAIPGAKVGGIADVMRDIPGALAEQGARVTTLMPAYGSLHRLQGSRHHSSLTTSFRGRTELVEIHELFPGRDAGVTHFVFHHPLFAACGTGSVYCDDPSDQPFATDATKFALFGLAAACAIREGHFGDIDRLHCHDWHAAFTLILRAYAEEFTALRSIPVTYSIHNLALQGIRPFAEHPSALATWFPGIPIDRADVADPRWPDCVNPMAAAIRLADRVHTVSPTYAREILEPNKASAGFHGGEGLEADLRQAADQGRLVGIINGIDYAGQVAGPLDWTGFMNVISRSLAGWIGQRDTLRSADFLAHGSVRHWQSTKRPKHVLTSVGRLTEQKIALLLQTLDDGRTALEHLLERLGERGVFIILGTGDKALESRLRRTASRHDNLIFLNGYSQALSDLLFANGDVFLMPSSFEPCGISQMLAMRHGQPCLVHAVGGLRDTVVDDVDGFHFVGSSMVQQARGMLERLDQILRLRETDHRTFREIATRAHQRRFAWDASARRYLTELYQ